MGLRHAASFMPNTNMGWNMEKAEQSSFFLTTPLTTKSIYCKAALQALELHQQHQFLSLVLELRRWRWEAQNHPLSGTRGRRARKWSLPHKPAGVCAKAQVEHPCSLLVAAGSSFLPLVSLNHCCCHWQNKKNLHWGWSRSCLSTLRYRHTDLLIFLGILLFLASKPCLIADTADFLLIIVYLLIMC